MTGMLLRNVICTATHLLTDVLTHPPTMYSNASVRTRYNKRYVSAWYVRAQFVAVSYWDFHVFMIPAVPGIKQPVPGMAPFYAPRSPCWTASHVLLPGTPRAAASGRRCAVARPRGVGWCSGEPVSRILQLR